jgi:hypothetical protein
MENQMSQKSPLFARKQSGGMFAVVNETMTTGNIWFVDSGSSTGADSAGAGQNPDIPFLTVDYAIGKCTASNGDIIFVMPGHAETLSSAAAWAVDVAGITIKGLGSGQTVPLISIDTEHTEAAPILISAASCTIDNIWFIGINAGGSKDAIEITGSHTTIKNCTFTETSTDKELGIGAAYGVITILDASAVVDDTKILNCRMYGLAGNDESFISVTDGTNGATNVVIDGCYISGTFADDVIQADAGTNVNTPWVITNSVIQNLGGNNVAITIDTGAVFTMHNLGVFGAGSTTIPIVGYNASYMGNVYTCEPGAFGATGLIGSTTNWGA